MIWARFHPISRIAIVLCLVLGVASFTGWERVGIALAKMSPGGSFEERCQALPGNEVQVSLLPVDVVENVTTSYRTLTDMWQNERETHRTIGLTRAHFGHRSTVDFKGIEDRAGGRACVRPKLAVELYLQPLTVYVASEYANDPCRARVIREHEYKHVALYRSFVAEAVPRLAQELHRVVGMQPMTAASIEEAQGALDRRIGVALAAFMRDAERMMAARQAEVDTPEEYRHVQYACEG